MSEPIRSISEGTFVIGDTNGLTFEAGPGISVSQPSEGTVRIANDETVLWEGKQVAGNTVALSESAANFEKLAVFVSTEDTSITAPTKFESLQENSATYGTLIRPGGEVVKSIIAQETGLYVWGGEIKLKDTTCQIGSFRRLHAGSTNPIDHTSLTFLFKVVGINRKENA